MKWAFQSQYVYMLRAQSLKSHLTLGWPPWTVAHQAPLSTGFPRQKYWNGLPFPPPEDLTKPGNQTCISCVSCIGRHFFFLPLEHLGSPYDFHKIIAHTDSCCSYFSLSVAFIRPFSLIFFALVKNGFNGKKKKKRKKERNSQHISGWPMTSHLQSWRPTWGYQTQLASPKNNKSFRKQ